MERRTDGISPIWVLLGVALGLRLLFWLPYYLPGDALNYLNAGDIFADRGLGNIMHAVRLGMIAPMGFLQGLGGHHLIAVYFLATSLGAVWLVYRLAVLWGGSGAGIVAAGILAVAPMEVAYGTVPLPDGPLSFYALAAFYLLVQAPRRPELWSWAALGAGVLLGVAYTCKVTALFFALPAVVQVFVASRRYKVAFIFLCGLGLVVAGEAVILRLLAGEWHFRILETLGFVVGSKGNYVAVEKTGAWWFGQIWFKLGAMLWAGHLPTALLLACVPHVTLWALWRLRDRIAEWGWLAAWGGIWVAQQLVISSIEQEPRYLQAAMPYAALVIGLGFGAAWERWRPAWRYAIVAGACSWSLAAVGVFWGAFSPQAAATRSLVERFDALQDERGRMGGPSEYVLRLAHYRGWSTTLESSGRPITHWAQLSNGYSTAVDGRTPPPGHMQAVFQADFTSPLTPVFAACGIAPGIGTASSARVFRDRSAVAAVLP